METIGWMGMCAIENDLLYALEHEPLEQVLLILDLLSVFLEEDVFIQSKTTRKVIRYIFHRLNKGMFKSPTQFYDTKLLMIRRLLARKRFEFDMETIQALLINLYLTNDPASQYYVFLSIMNDNMRLVDGEDSREIVKQLVKTSDKALIVLPRTRTILNMESRLVKFLHAKNK